MFQILTLKEARKRSGKTQEALGFLSGVGVRAAGEIERGNRIPTPEQKEKILEVLGMDESDVILCTPCYKSEDGKFVDFSVEIDGEPIFDEIEDDEDDGDEW